MRLLLFFVAFTLMGAETAVPKVARAPRPVTLSDAKPKKNKYRAPKPHTARRAKDASKRVRGPEKMHPVWGKPKGKR